MKLAVLSLILVLAAFGCMGATQGQVDDVLKLDEGKTIVYADVSESFSNLVAAVASAVDANSPTGKKMVEAKAYIEDQNDRFEQLARDSVTAVMSMQELPADKRQEYLETIFLIIGKLKDKQPAINNLEFAKPATP